MSIRHFTATAFIVDSRKRTLLLWHKRLKRWMPPGGHLDENETPEDCARRECKEETGLDVDILGLEDLQHLNPNNHSTVQPFSTGDLFAGNRSEGRMLLSPVAMLLEEIPASPERGEGAHQHMDFLFVATLKDESQTPVLAEDEGREMRWFTRDEVAGLGPEEIFRNVQAYILGMLKTEK